VRRERIARRYTIPTTVSACLNRQPVKMWRIAEINGANLNRSGTDEEPVRFCGEATVGLGLGGFSSTLAPMMVDAVVGCGTING